MNCKHCDSKHLDEVPKVFSDGRTHLEIVCRECSGHNGYAKSVENKDFVMPFGKHKGTKLAEIPNDYLLWGVMNFDKGNIKDRFDEEKETRKL